MIKPSQWLRLCQIFYTWVRYGLDEIAFSTPWLSPFRFFVWLNPLYWLSHRRLTQGERLRLALESLGPLFVKFGQILSTRRDILPDEIATELAKLQDKVKPFDSELAIQTIQKNLKKPLSECFSEFNPIPLASASIAQVHTARLANSYQEVVVKVLRPQIAKIIKRDIALMYLIAKMAERTNRLSRRLRAIDIVAEIERTLLDELDLTREGANAVQLKRNLKQCPWVKIPQVYWDYSGAEILTLEKINGIPIADLKALDQAGVNRALLAERLIQTFYYQAFNDCFFHADLHPGNIFVSRDHPDNPTLQLVDFGIVGSLDPTDQHYLAANFLAFFKQDYRRVAKLHIESGWVPAKTRVDEFESAMRAVCEPIFDRPLKEISLGQTLLRLLQIAQRFHMNIQPQLILLQKTLWNIEGIGRNLYPDLDIWRTSKPFLENWMKQQVGVKGLWKNLKAQWSEISQSLPELPELMIGFLKSEKEKTLQLRLQKEEVLQYTHHQSSKKSYRLLWLGLGIGIIASGLLLNFSHLADWPEVRGNFLTLGGIVISLLAVLKI